MKFSPLELKLKEAIFRVVNAGLDCGKISPMRVFFIVQSIAVELIQAEKEEEVNRG